MEEEYKIQLLAKTDFWDSSVENNVLQKLLDLGISVESVYCRHSTVNGVDEHNTSQ